MSKHRKIRKNLVILVVLCVLTFGVATWMGASYQIETGDFAERQSRLIEQISSYGEQGYQGRSLAGHYLASRHAESEKDISAAAHHMAEALRRDRNGNLELMQEALRVLVAAGDMEKAIVVSEEVLELESSDPLAAMVQIVRLTKAGRFAEAREALSKPADVGMFHIIRPVISQWIDLGENPHVAEPIRMDETIKQAGFLAPFIEYQLALMNDMVGQKEAALKGYHKSVTNPDVMPYRLVQAVSNFYLREGSVQKAQETFDRYAEQNPSSELIPSSLPQGNLKPDEVVPMVETATQGLAEILFTTASLLFGEQVTKESMIYLNMALYLRPDFPPAQLMLGNVYERLKDYESAVESYAAISPDTIFYERGKIRTALNYQAMGENDKAISMLKEIARNDKKAHEAYTTLGDVYRTKKDYEKATDYYSKALESEIDSEEQNWSIHYVRGICFERLDEWEKAEADFKRALELEPDQPDVLNYLGYSWLVKNKNVELAKEYIQTALDQRPNDAHIIDSMGWAHYLIGEFEEAVAYLEQAAEMTPQDPTINDHLGDVYWRVGRRIEAQFQWDRALNFEPENEAEIRAKLEVGLPPFEAAVYYSKEKKEAPVAAVEVEKSEDIIKE